MQPDLTVSNQIKPNIYSEYNADNTYNNLLKRVLSEGVTRDDRTGTGTKAVFGHQMRFDLGNSFPLLTVKMTCNKWSLLLRGSRSHFEFPGSQRVIFLFTLPLLNATLKICITLLVVEH